MGPLKKWTAHGKTYFRWKVLYVYALFRDGQIDCERNRHVVVATFFRTNFCRIRKNDP